ncbi:MAG: chorismate pyruvate-lyase family protein [Nitrospira sp.]|nr:chorismate pyruvate-lyase family protein [Nitrospira sp.]
MFLENYYLSRLPFKDVSFDKWMNIEGFISSCKTQYINPLTRLTLLSDGSLVRILRALYLTEISVQVEDQRLGSMPAKMAKYLDSSEDAEATARDAWLCCNGHNIVYAHSVIDSSNIEGVIQKGIDRKSKPVGILLGEYNIPIIKDQVFIVRLKSADLAEQFDVHENVFWSRCYRLRGGEGFNAAIFEVFSPDLLTFGS